MFVGGENSEPRQRRARGDRFGGPELTTSKGSNEMGCFRQAAPRITPSPVHSRTGRYEICQGVIDKQCQLRPGYSL